MRQGLITELNLDRYDTTHLLWAHPHLSGSELTSLLFHCYRKFYCLSDSIRKARTNFKKSAHPIKDMSGSIASSLFHLVNGMLWRHPMSGGIGIRNIDRLEDYLSFRRNYFGDVLSTEGLFPLPANLELSESDIALNRTVKIPDASKFETV